MKISFSTLSCDWSFEKILEEASRLGYDGIEVRGIEGEMYLSKAKPFLPENEEATKKALKEKNIELSCMDTSCKFHDDKFYVPGIAEGKDTIDVASKFNVPYIRVFGNNVNKQTPEKSIEKISAGLKELCEYADGKGVTILLETHGDFSHADRVLEVIERVNHKCLGVLWDIEHPYRVLDEAPADTFAKLGKYIKHTHVKDAVIENKEAKLCMIGDGKMPIKEVVEVLKKNGFEGYLSLEWEQKWAPYMEDIDRALVVYIDHMKNIIQNV